MIVTEKRFVKVDEMEVWSEEHSAYVKRAYYDTCLSDMSDYGWVMVSKEPITVTFDVPDAFNFKQHQAEAIQTEMQAVRAKFQAKMTELERRYNECLAIEG